MPLTNLNPVRSSAAILTATNENLTREHLIDTLKSKEKNTVILKEESVCHFPWCSRKVLKHLMNDNTYVNNHILDISINTSINDNRLKQVTKQYVGTKNSSDGNVHNLSLRNAY